MSEDRPQYQRDTVPTNAEIAERMRKLADDMHAIGVDMAQLGGVEYRVQGNGLSARAINMLAWAHEIEEAQG